MVRKESLTAVYNINNQNKEKKDDIHNLKGRLLFLSWLVRDGVEAAAAAAVASALQQQQASFGLFVQPVLCFLCFYVSEYYFNTQRKYVAPFRKKGSFLFSMLSNSNSNSVTKKKTIRVSGERVTTRSFFWEKFRL